jgi:hypothetical protein
MKLIESKTLGGTTANVEFTSIPQTFTDLVLMVSGRSTRATEIRDELHIRFSGDTGSNYSVRTLIGTGSSVISGTGFFSDRLSRMDMTASGATSNTFGNMTIYIPNYTSSVAKSVSVDNVIENNATESYQSIIAGLWNNSGAITSIYLEPEVSDFASGSIFSLYGVLKGSDGIVTTS